jgi:hypothetical protein
LSNLAEKTLVSFIGAVLFNRRGDVLAEAWHGKHPGTRQGHGNFPDTEDNDA